MVQAMGRPKTKGQRITISLTLAASAEAEQRAERAGLSLKDWMESQLERALVPQPRMVHGETVAHTTPRHTDAMTRAAQQAATAKLTRPDVEPRFKP